jgi:hypothetical protein
MIAFPSAEAEPAATPPSPPRYSDAAVGLANPQEVISTLGLFFLAWSLPCPATAPAPLDPSVLLLTRLIEACVGAANRVLPFFLVFFLSFIFLDVKRVVPALDTHPPSPVPADLLLVLAKLDSLDKSDSLSVAEEEEEEAFEVFIVIGESGQCEDSLPNESRVLTLPLSGSFVTVLVLLLLQLAGTMMLLLQDWSLVSSSKSKHLRTVHLPP